MTNTPASIVSISHREGTQLLWLPLSADVDIFGIQSDPNTVPFKLEVEVHA